MEKIRVTLPVEDRFAYCGRRVVRFTFNPATPQWVSLWARSGFVGSFDPRNIPTVYNALRARGVDI